MTEITTAYREYKIGYAENEDVWRCWDLGVAAPTLGKVKAMIDSVLREAMKAAAPAVWNISWGDPRLVKITSLDADGKHAWVMDDGKRQKVNLRNLILSTPEHDVIIAVAIREREDGLALLEAADRRMKALRRWRPSPGHLASEA